ncbi:condensation domain-containing protein [Pseudomonas sp. NCCP-436]|uniref:condensation domain-containing protein n=1 Tax=Pseudomonas sp. NCCP-436 TaxID=2842481 RepID=UPI001DE3D44D|nr:condensation domain-containing protein [Pseudomonas sp. NCCP-436]GIZ12519.1 hypothetical protein NCCP436_19350 [Pseudomonas sp. NCCP-436]
MKDTHPHSPSATEEHIWLLQEQQPERVLQTLEGWRLRGREQLPQIIEAVRRLLEALPQLNARYRFSEDGELHRQVGTNWQDCLQWLHAVDVRQAVEQLLEHQLRPWCAANEPPFKVWLVEAGDDLYLVMQLHRILGCETALLGERLAAAAAGRPLAALPEAGQTLLAEPTAFSPLPGLRRQGRTELTISGPFWDAPLSEDERLALRWQARLPMSGTELELASISQQFARFVARLGGHEALKLMLHRQGCCQAIVLNEQSGPEDLLYSAAAQSDTGQASLPEVAVHWLPAASESMQALFVGPLALPSAELRADLQLSLQAWPDGSLWLSLETGQGLWAYAGSYLLGSLLSSIAGGSSLALPAPLQSGAGDEICGILLEAFREALGEPHLTAADDFFDHGGHSMLATMIIGRLRSQYGFELSLGDFFSASSAASLAARVRRTASQERDELVAETMEDAPLALAQASLGRAYQAFDFGTVFNLPFALRFLDPVDEHCFGQAFGDLLVRHASLRSTYHFEQGEGRQRVVPVCQLSRFKWFWSSAESTRASLASEAAWRFDLTRELPVRVRFLREPGSDQQVLSMLIHHMAIDEWSLNVMMKELAQAYRARTAGRAPQWAAPVPSFHSFAALQQSAGIDRQHLAHWVQHLQAARRGLILPDSGEPHAQPVAERAAAWFDIMPGEGVADALHSLARQQHASLFGVLYAAIALSLRQLAGLDELLIGTSASGRSDPAYFGTVGYFTTMVAHRVQFSAGQTVGELIAQVTRTISDSMAWATVPLEQIQQALGMTAADGLLFDVYVQIHANNALNGALEAADGSSVRYRQIDPDKSESMFGLQFEIMENQLDGERRLRLVVTYRRDRYTPGQMACLRELLDALITRLAQPGAAALSLSDIAA